MFGELDKSVTPLQRPFKTILLSHKEANRAKSKERAEEKKIYYKIFW